MPCFRRLNATHQTGCTSKRGGNVGILQVVNTTNALNEIIQNGHTPPYVIVLPYQFFNSSNLSKMRNSGKVSGVLVIYPEDSRPSEIIKEGFSSDKTCPNFKYGMYRENQTVEECSTKNWNPYGQNVLFEDWGFPIFIIRDKKDIDNINTCYDRYNSPDSSEAKKWPYCAAELRSYMLAAKDTRTCIRRSRLQTNINPVIVCDPLGDKNIWLTLNPTNKSSPLKEKSLIVVATRIDAASLFDGWSPGAHTAVTGLVTLLATADALSRVWKESPIEKNVMFVIFTGESFDYIGSSRMVYEMENNRFPSPLDNSVTDQASLINLNTISHFIELSQMSSNTGLFIHVDKKNFGLAEKEIDRMKKLLTSKRKVKIIDSNTDTLPPASLQSFLRKYNKIPGIVLADHNTSYQNRFYNSLFDINWGIMDTWNIKEPIFNQLANVASAVAETVFTLATNSNKTLEVNNTFIKNLLECYLNNSDCPLFLQTTDPSYIPSLKDEALSLYVSVNTYINPITKMTIGLLAYLTGEKLPNVTKSECQKHRENQVFRYFWMIGHDDDKHGICVKSTVNYSEAVSPAFEIDDYDFLSGEYSTWTESVWEESSVRIFLKPSQEWEVTVLMTGIVIFLISFVIVWFFNRNAAMLFARNPVGC